MSTAYDPAYFEGQHGTARRSAEVVVPLVMELLSPRSVCDVGCGVGVWLAVFEQHGVKEVVGLDGDYVERDALHIDPAKFVSADLARGVPAVGSFDLAVSLEVAEHLPERAAAEFVAGLVSLAPAVLFSAAIPGQGGQSHVNEQWPPYWRALFLKHGYRPIDCVRPPIWDSGKVKVWYRQNTLLFAHPELIRSNPALARERERTAGQPLSIVHPKMLQIALQRPWVAWQELAAEVDAGRLTRERMHEQMAQILKRGAGSNS
jgi:SAM-dependent methyltransferase